MVIFFVGVEISTASSNTSDSHRASGSTEKCLLITDVTARLLRFHAGVDDAPLCSLVCLMSHLSSIPAAPLGVSLQGFTFLCFTPSPTD